MKTTLDMTRIWAAATGLLLAIATLVRLSLGSDVSDTLPMMVAACAGFELFLFAQDIARRRARNG